MTDKAEIFACDIMYRVARVGLFMSSSTSTGDSMHQLPSLAALVTKAKSGLRLYDSHRFLVLLTSLCVFLSSASGQEVTLPPDPRTALEVSDGPPMPPGIDVLKPSPSAPSGAPKKPLLLRSPKHEKTYRVMATTTAAECDILVGGATGLYPVDVTLQPGVPVALIWDFSGCLTGAGTPEPLQSLRFFATQPRNKRGFQAALPVNTPLTLTVTNLNTGQSWGAIYFWANIGSVTGGKFVVNLSLDSSAKKPLSVEITHVENIGG